MSFTLLLQLLGVLSVLTFVGSLLAIPIIIARLPQNFFVRHRQKVEERHRRHPLMALIILLVRNSIGAILVIAGIAMLVLPGQGIITILIGISFMDFPGKRRLVDTCVNQQRVRKVLNWIRLKEKKSPFEFSSQDV